MSKIVDKEMWDHYSELPNPAWYDYKNKKEMNKLILYIISMSSNSVNSEVYVKLEDTYSYKQYIEIYTNQDKTIQFLNFLFSSNIK